MRARIVVDATGRGTLLGRQLRLKRTDPSFRQFAVHGWFEGVDRGDADTAEWIHLHVLPGPRAWAWQIPISAGVTSVGVVCESDAFPKAGHDLDRFFAEAVASSPALVRRMAGARPLHALQREGNYSYAMERLAGDGWLLVGDAARFVDPLFSSGLSVAAESARAAAGGDPRAPSPPATSRPAPSRATSATCARASTCGASSSASTTGCRAPSCRCSPNPDDRELLREVLQGDVYEGDGRCRPRAPARRDRARRGRPGAPLALRTGLGRPRTAASKRGRRRRHRAPGGRLRYPTGAVRRRAVRRAPSASAPTASSSVPAGSGTLSA